MATLLKTDGTSIEITPGNGTDFSLADLRNYIECEYIEVIYLNNSAYQEGDPEGLIMIGDEEARLFDNPLVNIAATQLYRESWEVGFGYTIVGNIILCKSKELQ